MADMALALPYTDSRTGCIYLDDKSPCGMQYYGYPIKGGIFPGFPTDYAGVVKVLTGLNDAETIRGQLASAFQCNIMAESTISESESIKKGVQSLRYQVSTFCAKVMKGLIIYFGLTLCKIARFVVPPSLK